VTYQLKDVRQGVGEANGGLSVDGVTAHESFPFFKQNNIEKAITLTKRTLDARLRDFTTFSLKRSPLSTQ
jgi:hypothetical protein